MDAAHAAKHGGRVGDRVSSSSPMGVKSSTPKAATPSTTSASSTTTAPAATATTAPASPSSASGATCAGAAAAASIAAAACCWSTAAPRPPPSLVPPVLSWQHPACRGRWRRRRRHSRGHGRSRRRRGVRRRLTGVAAAAAGSTRLGTAFCAASACAPRHRHRPVPGDVDVHTWAARWRAWSCSCLLAPGGPVCPRSRGIVMKFCDGTSKFRAKFSPNNPSRVANSVLSFTFTILTDTAGVVAWHGLSPHPRRDVENTMAASRRRLQQAARESRHTYALKTLLYVRYIVFFSSIEPFKEGSLTFAQRAFVWSHAAKHNEAIEQLVGCDRRCNAGAVWATRGDVVTRRERTIACAKRRRGIIMAARRSDNRAAEKSGSKVKTAAHDHGVQHHATPWLRHTRRGPRCVERRG